MPDQAHRSSAIVEAELRTRAVEVERILDANLLSYSGPVDDSAANALKVAIETIKPRKQRLVVNLETGGGFIESAERMAHIFRHHYRVVDFIVTTYAMSAGTVLVMSGDEIYMDYSATLGPIDPQILRPDNRGGQRYVPALGYLEQYERLIERSKTGALSHAELAYLLQNFDPAELYQYEQARDLSIALLEEWLVKYKFKNWTVTQTRGKQVTRAMRRARAEEIAKKLNDTKRWHSHGRGISMQLARRELKLQIEDLDSHKPLRDALSIYNRLLLDYRFTRGDDYFALDWVGGYHGH